MRWRVEYITIDSANIIVDDPKIDAFDQEPVGMGFPVKLAERLVEMHNKSIDLLQHGVANAVTILKNAIRDSVDYMDHHFEEDAHLYIQGTEEFMESYTRHRLEVPKPTPMPSNGTIIRKY